MYLLASWIRGWRSDQIHQSDITSLQLEVEQLAARNEIQRLIYEVNAGLISCASVEDAYQRLDRALRTFWSFHHLEILIQEQHTWRHLYQKPSAMRSMKEIITDGGSDVTPPPPASRYESVLLPHQQQEQEQEQPDVIFNCTAALKRSTTSSGSHDISSSQTTQTTHNERKQTTASQRIARHQTAINKATQAVIILRQATAQPSIAHLATNDIEQLAHTMRGQLNLTLRRVLLHQSFQELGRIDPLTSCLRRWYGEQRCDEIIASGDILTLLIIDIDHFSRVNAEFGHRGGDQVLSALGSCLRRQLRNHDLIARIGGEEFLILLPGTQHDAAMAVAERLRVAAHELSDVPCQISISIGLACCHYQEARDRLMRRADAALYEAKHNGRNQTQSAEIDPTSDLIRRIPELQTRPPTSKIMQVKK